MLPTLQSGDSILVVNDYYRTHPPQIGELVLCEHPHRSGYRMVKRIVNITSSGVDVHGDNPAQSTDSRHFGPITLEHLLAKVCSRL